RRSGDENENREVAGRPPRPRYPESTSTGPPVAVTRAEGAPRVTVLDEILDGVRADLALRQARVPLEVLKEQAASCPPARDSVAPTSCCSSRPRWSSRRSSRSSSGRRRSA